MRGFYQVLFRSSFVYTILKNKMIKKLKIISLFVTALSLLTGQMVYAAAGDLTWGGASQTIDFSSPDMNAIIASGSTAEAMVLGAGSLTMTLASGDVFTIATEAAGNFAVSPTTGVVISCSSSTIATVTITATGSQSYTLTPSATACDYSSPSGGGGASSTPPPTTPPATPAPTTTPPVTPATPATPAQKEVPGCGNRTTGFSVSTGESCAMNNPATPATPASPSADSQGKSYAFGTALVKQGSKGAACKAWQMFLNDNASAGLKADGMCGKLTMVAAKAWQKSVGLPADGLLGKMSRAKAMGN